MFRDGLLNSNVSIFRAHLIWLSGPRCNPTVRILLNDDGAVYEGIASWSKYCTWLGSFLDTPDQKLGDLKKCLGRNKYAVLSDVTISFDDLDAYGLQRADQ